MMSSARKTGKRKGSESNLKQTSMGNFINPTKNKDQSFKRKKNKSFQKMSSFVWTRGSYQDTKEYRDHYPDKKDHPGLEDNYLFYTNQIPSKPDGDLIDNIHKNWWGDYSRLERHHGYIQWLFPIRDSGMNWHAQELQLHEIEKLKSDENAMQRLLKSYEMMLDFYGMKLIDKSDGTIDRAENWSQRFHHLNRSYHNYLRITRILKCLGEFEFEHLKSNFVKFVMHEGIIKHTLPNTIDSCMKYWVGVLRDDSQRIQILEYYDKLCEEDNDDTEEDDEKTSSATHKTERTKQATASAAQGKNDLKSTDHRSDGSNSEDDKMNKIKSLTELDNEENKASKGVKSNEDEPMSDGNATLEITQDEEVSNRNENATPNRIRKKEHEMSDSDESQETMYVKENGDYTSQPKEKDSDVKEEKIDNVEEMSQKDDKKDSHEESSENQNVDEYKISKNDNQENITGKFAVNTDSLGSNKDGNVDDEISKHPTEDTGTKMDQEKEVNIQNSAAEMDTNGEEEKGSDFMEDKNDIVEEISKNNDKKDLSEKQNLDKLENSENEKQENTTGKLTEMDTHEKEVDTEVEKTKKLDGTDAEEMEVNDSTNM